MSSLALDLCCADLPDTTRNADVVATFGDAKASQLAARIHLGKWDGECVCRLHLPEADGLDHISDGKSVLMGTADKEFRVYEVGKVRYDTKTVWGMAEYNTEGGVEFDITLLRQPHYNVIEFGLETQNLEFLYQPFMTDADREEMHWYRPPHAEGSYAVYHSGNPVNWEGRTVYGTGKVGHIYRPLMVAADGATCWGDLLIDQSAGVLAVTIPQEFLDKAAYPVRQAGGLNFGYETIGGSTNSLNNNMFGSVFAGAVGAGQSMSLYHASPYSGVAYKMALYNASTLALVGSTNEGTSTIETRWSSLNFSSGPTLSAINYLLLAWGASGGKISWLFYFDTGSDNQGAKKLAVTYTGTFPDPLVSPTYTTNKQSIYCTYTAGGGGEPAGVKVRNATLRNITLGGS